MATLQQVVEQLALLATAARNTAMGANATSTPASPQGPLELVTSLTKVLFSAKALRDWAIILVIGSLFETGRRFFSGGWSWLINSFFLTAVFDDTDPCYQWILFWLSKQPSWKGARNVQISTSTFGLSPSAVGTPDTNDDPTLDLEKISYIPAVSESYTLWYKYRWMQVTRTIETHRGGWCTTDRLTLRIFARDHQILTEILQRAKNDYHKAQKDAITIYASAGRFGSGDGWRELARRPKRPLDSIILDPGVVDLVVEDARDFLSSKQWYSDRGIPFRRGYLLYGAPGSGKTSLIHSIAGELGLNVYIISLSRSGLDDSSLAELISDLPERCIALMEDIDAAFHHGLSRESASPPVPSPAPNEPDQQQLSNGPPAPTGSRVSLSGLLNALDGIAAQEGRILFATTNKYSSLDPALCRPGRMDIHIEFENASQYQAEELFKRFYAPSDALSGANVGKEVEVKLGKMESASASDESGFEDVPANDSDLINLSESSTVSEKAEPDTDVNALTFTGVSHRLRAPQMSADQMTKLAAQFAASIPDRRMSMASLQGFLMTHKTRPREAVTKVSAWVEQELADREKKALGA